MENPSNPAELAKIRRSLHEAHAALLAVHKSLLDHERARYERKHGRIGSPGETLQLVINDPWFAWLRPLSGMITQIDEFLSARKPPDPRDGDALLTQSRTLLTPAENAGTFQSHYMRAIQESPEIAAAHGQWKLTLLQIGLPR